jgi:hypothetical protein
METKNKDLECYRKNAEEDYLTTPISVLRYISEMEQALHQQPVNGLLPSQEFIQELIEMLKECRDLLVMCTLIDKSGDCKSLVDKVDSKMGWQCTVLSNNTQNE